MALGLIRRAKKHLRKNKMTYSGHFIFAFTHGVRCVLAAVLLIIHAVFPFWFRGAGGRLVRRLEQDFVEHKCECRGKK